MAMDTEASLQRVPAAEPARPGARPPRSARAGARLRRHGRARREGDPHDRQDLWEVRESIEGRADFDLVIVDAAATGHIVVPARRGRRDLQELVDVGPLRNQTQWIVGAARRSRGHRGQRRDDARGDAGRGDDRARRADARPRSTSRSATVIVNRVLPELFTHGDEETFEALREPEATELLTSRRGRGAVAGARRGAARGVAAAHRARLHRRARATASISRCSTCRISSCATHGLRVTRMVADALGAGARSVSRARADAPSTTLEQLFAAKEIVVFCGSGGVGKTSVAAAAALGAVGAPRRQGARAHDRSGPPARDRARARRHRQRGAPRADRGAQGGRRRAARRALGRDARHQAVVGRPRDAPRAGRGDRVPHPREPAVPQPHGALRAEPRLHRDGAPVRDPRERRVRPDRHRHAADPQRDRLPRRAGAHGRLLRRPAAALADAAVPRRRQAQPARDQRREPPLLPNRRSHPRQQVPRGHRRVLPQLPVDVRRVRRAGRRRSSGCCTTGARRSRSSPRSRPRRCTRPSGSARRCASASSTSARWCSTRRCPTRCSIRRDRPRPPRSSTTRARSPTASPRRSNPRSADAGAHGAGAAHDRGVVRELLGRRDARGRAARRAGPRARRRRAGPDLRATTSATSTALDRDRPFASTRSPYHRPREHARRPGPPRTALGGADLVHLERLVASWRPLADLSFSDLLLLAPITGEEGHRFVVLAQVRPVTGQTNYPQDLVGTVVDEVERPLLARCWRSGEIGRGRHVRARLRRTACACSASRSRRDGRLIGLRDPRGVDDARPAVGRARAHVLRDVRPLRPHDRRRLVPVRRRRGRDRERAACRRRRDRHRRRDAGEVREPERGQLAAPHGHPHVRADAAPGRRRLRRRRAARARCCCTFRSPRRSSATTCRCSCGCCRCFEGEAADRRAAPDARRQRPPPPRPHAALEGRDDPRDPPPGEEQPADDRVAAAAPGPAAAVARGAGRARRSRSGASVRSRSCTRRCRARPATSCAFNEIVRPLARLVEDTSSSPDLTIRFTVEGDAGELPGEVATPLAVVLNELMQNAVDHAFPEGVRDAQVDVMLGRDDDHVEIEVRDNGDGPARAVLARGRHAGSASRSCRRS